MVYLQNNLALILAQTFHTTRLCTLFRNIFCLQGEMNEMLIYKSISLDVTYAVITVLQNTDSKVVVILALFI